MMYSHLCRIIPKTTQLVGSKYKHSIDVLSNSLSLLPKIHPIYLYKKKKNTLFRRLESTNNEEENTAKICRCLFSDTYVRLSITCQKKEISGLWVYNRLRLLENNRNRNRSFRLFNFKKSQPQPISRL